MNLQGEWKIIEEKLPSLGERMEEAMVVAGVELTPDSTLKKLRTACEFLKIGKTGSKAQVWQRLKQAVSANKMKELVEISKGLEVEFSREPKGEKRPEDPTEEERRKHELTHLPKADWRESCQATRSREDNFEVSEKTNEASLVSMDFKFTGTRDEENTKDNKDALTIGLVMVDQATKFVHVIPVPTKEVTPYLVEEVCRVLMLLNSKVILRTDTEPAMISLRKKVQGIRKMKNLDTEVQDVAPDEHQGLQVERWVQTVRNLSKTLVYGVESKAKVKITSESTLYPWAARHAAFLLNRFVVRKGSTPFEVLFDREYKGTLSPCGSVVLAKPVRKVKEKGEPWIKGIFVGKDSVSNLNLVSTRKGIVKCRTMRQCAPLYDVEVLAEATGTPWNNVQDTLVGRKQTKTMKRLPTSSGIEITAGVGDGSKAVPRREQGQEEDELKDYSPSQVAASDPPSDDEQDENEDPGEGQMGSSSSSSIRGQGVTRRRSERSDGSEEMIPDTGGGPPTSPKRNLERGEEPEAVRARLDEGTTEVEERPEKFIAVGEPSSTVRRVIAARSVKKIEPFLRKELPKYHDDEEVDLDEFENIEAEIEEDEWWCESDGEEETPEGMPTWSNDFESGPPKIEGEELAKVDGVSRAHEVERLTKMKVLNKLPKDADLTKYKFLSTKVVYDWRHRESEWRRRGRLVVREFRWLGDTDIASLFSPTGVASTVKLLSALFSSSEGYSLGSIDVGDAYLMVEQEEPTVVEVDGEYYELGFTLPGQRIGSSAWFKKLKGYLEEYGMKSDDGLPALFSKMPNKNGKGIILLTHVDDMELYASKEDFEKLVEFLKSKGLKLKVEGPLDEKEGSIGFLKRSFKSTHEGDVEITMNSKYIEGLVEVLKLEGAYPKRLPCPSDNGRSFQTKKDGMNPLSAEDHHTYRKGVGILLYLAPERPDIMYVLKKLSTKLAAPVEADMEMLRYVGKYLKGTPDLALIHKRSYPGKSFSEMRNRGTDDEDVERDNYKVPALIEVISDSDWAADRESRQSVSCGVIMVKEPRLVLFSDSSSSRQLIARKGLGKARHLDVDLLWIQRIPKLIIKAIKGKDNPSDLGTKSLTRDKIKKYMVTLGYVGEYLDQEAQEVQAEEVRRASSRSKMSFDEKTVTRMIQAVTTAVLISLAEAQREDEEGLGSAVSVWMNCMMFMSWFICVAAAIFQIKPLQRSSQEGKRRKEEKEEKRKKRKMASDDDLKKLMGKTKSIASVSFVERQLKKKIEERCSVAEGEDQVKELNKQREGHPSPEPKKPVSDAGSDPTSSEDEKEEKKGEEEKEKKKEKESSSESSSSDEEKKEEFKKTAEELKREAVMKGRNKDLEKMKEDAEERRRKIAAAAKSLAEKAEETNEDTAAGKAEETEKETAAGKAEEADKETAAGKAEEIEVDEEKRDQEERRRLKTDFDIYTQSLWPVITTDIPEEPQKIRVGLPSQDLERQFNLLREITLKHRMDMDFE